MDILKEGGHREVTGSFYAICGFTSTYFPFLVGKEGIGAASLVIL